MPDLILYEGRPKDCSGRLDKEIAVYDFLDALKVSYFRTDHEPADTMEHCHEIDGCLQVNICKNLFLCNRQKTQFYLLIMPGNKPFKTKELSAQLQIARLSFGSSEDMEKLLNVTPGSVTVMGLLFDKENKVRLLVDEDLKKEEWFGCHPCINTSSLKFTSSALFDSVIPALKHDPTFVKLTGEQG